MHAQNKFRIIEIQGGISEAQAKSLLSRLPILFHLRKGLSVTDASATESLEAYVHGPIVSIYPPTGRVIAVAMLDWSGGAVRAECMDMQIPGGGQVKTSIRFDPKILGIDWPSLISGKLAVDIHVYPKEKGSEQEFDVPTYHDDLVTSGAMK